MLYWMDVSHLSTLHEEWEWDECVCVCVCVCVCECDRHDSNTQNDVVRAEVHKRKVRGRGELKSKTRITPSFHWIRLRCVTRYTDKFHLLKGKLSSA